MNVLIGDFLGDESIEQPGCKLRIFRFFRNERSSGLDRQKVKFPGRCFVIETANRFTRDMDWVDGWLALGSLHDFEAGFGAVTGTSSDLQACPIKMIGVSTGPSSRFQRKPVLFGRSILLTAAGQSRIRTGFPLGVPMGNATSKRCST